MSTAETQQAHGADAHDEHEHISPVKVYLGVFGALVFLTVLTVVVSYLGLPPTISIMAALAVAAVKAGFVVGYFMHLKYDARFNSIIFFGSLIFVVIFFVFTMADLAARKTIHEIEGTHVKRNERRLEQLEKESLQKKKTPAKTPAHH